jgi:hypothetical protein
MSKPVIADQEMTVMEVVSPLVGATMTKMMKMEGLLELGPWVAIPGLPVVLSGAGNTD